MKLLVSLTVATLVCSSFVQAWAQERRQTAPLRDPCASEKQMAYSQAFEAATELLAESFDVRIAEAPKPLQISLTFDGIDEVDPYRIAAAEVIRSEFSNWFAIAPESPLKLYIYRTETDPTTSGLVAENIHVQVAVWTAERLNVGEETRSLGGKFVLAGRGWLFVGMVQEGRTQRIRDSVYKVLSEFLEKWQQAPSE